MMVADPNKGVTVSPMPLVGTEVRRLGAALDEVSTQLSVAIKALTEFPLASIATPRADAAVGAALSDLAEACGVLRTLSDDSAAVTTRHTMAGAVDAS